MPKTSRLSLSQQANLFLQLKNLEIAGFPAIQACTLLLKTEKTLTQPLQLMAAYLNAGQPIASAAYKSGLFTSNQYSLVQAAEASGQLAEIYGRLFQHYSKLASRVKKIQARLYLPVFMMVAGIFIQPLPALVTQQIQLDEYLFSTVGCLLQIAVGVALLINLPTLVKILGVESAWHRLILTMPLIGNWLIKREIHQFIFLLALLLQAGLAFSEALPKAIASIKNSQLRAAFQPAIKNAQRGDSVYAVLSAVAVMPQTTLQIINSSEHSGKLAQGLLHLSQLEGETIALADDALAEWLPRLVYAVIAGGMAYSLTGSPIGTVMPDGI